VEEERTVGAVAEEAGQKEVVLAARVGMEKEDIWEVEVMVGVAGTWGM